MNGWNFSHVPIPLRLRISKTYITYVYQLAKTQLRDWLSSSTTIPATANSPRAQEAHHSIIGSMLPSSRLIVAYKYSMQLPRIPVKLIVFSWSQQTGCVLTLNTLDYQSLNN